jgi:methyl-accepting chemotaxis protein
LEASKKAQSGNQSVADVLENNVDVADQANKDIDDIRDTISEIAGQEDEGRTFKLQPAIFVVAGITLVSFFSFQAIRRRRKRPGSDLIEVSADDVSFEDLLKKIRADNLSQKQVKKVTPVKKAAAKRSPVKKATVKKATTKKSVVKKSSAKRKAK